MRSYRILLIALATFIATRPLLLNAQDDNPFVPQKLLEIADVLAEAVKDKGSPENTPLGIIANSVTPFWTATQIGAVRAANEIGAPVIFNAPIKPGDAQGQSKLVKFLIDDGYKGIAISVIDPTSMDPIIRQGLDKNINIITTDSDAPDSGRRLYIGTNNYKAGYTAGKELVRLLGPSGGRVVGLVGLLTAENAIERIKGIKDAIQGTNVTLQEIMTDDIDQVRALSNAESAIDKYPDLAAFIGIYAFDGPAAGQALRIAHKVGKIKVVAFDMSPDTIPLVRSGVISIAIVQRPYYWGYLGTYILEGMSVLGAQQTMDLLSPYLSGNKRDILDTDVDIVTPETLSQYLSSLDSIGIKSQ
ncbi:MAG: substrate-binding domain-containing protein [Chloroflexota bacterium]